MQFIMTGFKQEMGFRVYSFEGIAADRSRCAYTVKADLSLLRQHGIQIQELPLLCRGLLEQGEEIAPQAGELTFTEERMLQHAKRRAEAQAAAQAKRPKRATPAPTPYGSGWRSSRP